MFHYPCATASGAFQELGTLTVLCSQHISQVPILCESKEFKFDYRQSIIILIF